LFPVPCSSRFSFLVPVPCSSIRSSFLVRSSYFLVPCSSFLVPSSKFQVPCSLFLRSPSLVPRSSFPVPCSLFRVFLLFTFLFLPLPGYDSTGGVKFCNDLHFSCYQHWYR
jgi:hypothetical protein